MPIDTWFTSPSKTGGPHQCPRCKSNLHVDLMPIKVSYPSSDGQIIEESVGRGVSCFECGFVFAVTNGGVTTRKVEQFETSQEPQANKDRVNDAVSRVTEGLRWRKSRV